MKLLFLFLSITIYSFSCETPVFRYAMERWEASAFQLRVYHQQDLTSTEKQLLQRLETYAKSANIAIQQIDLRKQVPLPYSLKTIHQTEIQICFPTNSAVKSTFWQRPLTNQTVQQVISSKTQQQLVEKLTAGFPIVWLFLNGTDQAVNKQKLKELQAINQLLEKDISSDQLPKNCHHFPIVEMDRSDAILSALLLNSEPDLIDEAMPMLFPIYGRGRSLFGLIGHGINEKMLRQQTKFILGRCSCVVKTDNPGFDLILSAEWDKNLGESWIDEEELPTVSGFEDFIEESEQTESKSQFEALFSILISLIVGVVVVTFVIMLRKKGE